MALLGGELRLRLQHGILAIAPSPVVGVLVLRVVKAIAAIEVAIAWVTHTAAAIVGCVSGLALVGVIVIELVRLLRVVPGQGRLLEVRVYVYAYIYIVGLATVAGLEGSPLADAAPEGSQLGDAEVLEAAQLSVLFIHGRRHLRRTHQLSA